MRIVVVGAGIGGLALALLLPAAGHDVTVLDADPAPAHPGPEEAWAAWRRPGVAQFRQIHLFNARGRAVLRERLPAVLDAVRAAGAGEILLGGPGDDELVRLTCRRTTFEWAMRRVAEADGRARVVPSTTVAGLLGDRGRVTGVRTAAGEDAAADLVVDASGRASALPAWLAALGAEPPTHRRSDGGTVSFTRWYRLRSEASATLGRADLGYAVGVVAPADAGVFCLTFGCLAEDATMRALRGEAGFHAAVGAVPLLAAWADPDRSEVLGPVLSMADRANRLTVAARPTAGVVALGDAAMCTNPGYGRGVGLALVHAACLVDALDAVGDAGDAPLAVAASFAEATARELEPWFHAAVAADRVRLAIGRRLLAGERWEAVGGPGDDPAVRFARGAPAAGQRDPVVARAFQRAFQLLDPPSAYWGNPEIEARVEAVWRTLDRDPPPAPGPDHEAMADLLGRTPLT
ncbi:MAG TPA: FAD-dependent oxidoreductase [Acidimicrobiales bacterium]|nr:FAD-dependent oxidoreductase [Acidimicrobiales bacterium]